MEKNIITEMETNMENNTIILSIAIPTYNRKDMLKECIEKILTQNNGLIEIVISDNGSNDGTSQLCEDFVNKYPFIRYYRNEKNEGFDFNYRNCIKFSTGKYVLVLSDDDLISDNFISNFFELINKKEYDLIALNLKGFELDSKSIDEYDGQNFRFGLGEDEIYTKKEEKNFFERLSYWFTLVSMFVMKREKISNISDSIFEKYNGTWFMNVAHNMACISNGEEYVLSKKCFLNIRTMNYAHYNIYEVFFKKFKFVLYNCSSDFGIKKKNLKICYRKLLKEHMRFFEYEIRIGLICSFKTKPKFRYIFKTLAFKESWIYYLPVVFCPKFILKHHYRKRTKRKKE